MATSPVKQTLMHGFGVVIKSVCVCKRAFVTNALNHAPIVIAHDRQMALDHPPQPTPTHALKIFHTLNTCGHAYAQVGAKPGHGFPNTNPPPLRDSPAPLFASPPPLFVMTTVPPPNDATLLSSYGGGTSPLCANPDSNFASIHPSPHPPETVSPTSAKLRPHPVVTSGHSHSTYVQASAWVTIASYLPSPTQRRTPNKCTTPTVSNTFLDYKCQRNR